MNCPDPIFVTGASGFIGRDVVKQLSSRNYKLRALVRRLPQQGFDPSIEWVVGDLTRPDTYAHALDGARAVVHAALTDDLSEEPQATSRLQSLSAQAGVEKFIHLSSVVIYGNPECGIITEETAPIPDSDPYACTKLAIEEALRVQSGIPETVILRLGCVYGPGGWWGQGLLNQMQRGKLILVNDGAGIANLIHVTDIGAMVLLVLARENGPIDIFDVTDAMPVTWRRYFSELEKILGRTATVSMSAPRAREYGKKWLRPSLIRRGIRKIFGGQLIYPLDDKGIEGFASHAIYSSAKASTELAFRPAYDLEKGIETVRQFAQKARFSTTARSAHKSGLRQWCANK